MAYQYNREDGILDIQMEGRIDSPGATEFSADLNAIITPEDQSVILSMRRLEYINSAGMRALLEVVRDLQRRDAKFAIYSPIGPVKEVFQLSGFNRIMSIHDSRDGAIAEVTR